MQSRRKKLMQDLKAQGELSGRGSAGALTDLLYDELTDLPTVPLLLGRIRRMLRESKQLGLVSISVLQNERMEKGLGWEGYETLVRDVASFLVEIKKVALRREDYLSEVMISGNAFVILLSPPRGEQQISYPDMDKVRRRVAAKLNRFVEDRMPPGAQERLGLYIGCAVLAQDASVRFERLVYSALEEAFTDSLQQRKRQQRRETLRLKEVLRAGSIHAVYQPVVDLLEKRVIGYEALSRVSAEVFSGPDHLFKVALENDAIWKLERICRDRALRGARGLDPNHLLFLNMEPDSIHDPALRSEATFTLLREVGLKPSQIVLEMTEHSAVRDLVTFRQLLSYLQFHGFRLAIDDVGSGYSGLKSIAELKPDFIKIDMGLIRDVHLDPIKQDLTGTIARFSTSSGITLIAEGVETPDELRCLKTIGVRYAQGYLFARPGSAFPRARLEDLD
ncbi:MAG TPA: EAL domain-containing protein [Candidatus Polarisedimenticolia bacterium]|nr:EAL domain-containing protein [Candidatus Polarisedimenticolia bacterium]